MAAYTASKSGVLGLTRSLARDYGPDNIRVNAIAPGWIMTAAPDREMADAGGREELMRRQCLKRKLVPDEIAKFTVFLASDEASACTSSTTSWMAAGCEMLCGSWAGPELEPGPPAD